MHVFLILMFVSCMITHATCAIFTPDQELKITEYVKSLMKCNHNPGLSLTVVKGSSSWTRGFGLADLDTGREVREDTMFVIGSLGKAFTMTLLGSLLDETSYNWTTSLSDIEGLNLEFIDDTLTREVTLADLLAHRTGLSDVVDFGFIAGYPEGTTIDVLSRRVKYIPKQQDFRYAVLLYNNAMYVVLGHVIEHLGKDTWYNLMTSRIVEPLGMTSTRLMSRDDDVVRGNVAKPYIRPADVMLNATNGLYKITPLEPAGGIMSSAVDMAKWIRFNLNNGSTPDGRRLVDEELFIEAFKKQRETPFYSFLASIRKPKYPVNSLFEGYGYAWFTSTYRGHRRLSHSGGYFAYVALLWLFPDQDFGVFANVNGPGTQGTSLNTVQNVLYFVSDLLLGVEPWLNTTTACTYPEPWGPAPGTNLEPDLPVYVNNHLNDYVGVFGSEILPDISIVLPKGGSKLRLIWNRIKGDMFPDETADTFGFRITEPWEETEEIKIYGRSPLYPLHFSRDADGIVQNFTLTLTSDGKIVMPFRKDVCFAHACKSLSDHETNGALRARFKPSFSVLLQFVTAVLILVFGV